MIWKLGGRILVLACFDRWREDVALLEREAWRETREQDSYLADLEAESTQ